MSTLSGLTSKGEKTKGKFQCLDINNLYRVSRGENLEKQQQKSTHIKHGMQSLGKVPNARRAPKNLPSMKSEHSGTDAAIALVPQGGQGWGKQETTPPTTSTTSPTTPTTTSTSNSNNSSNNNININNNSININQTQCPPPPLLTPHQVAVALSASTTIPPPNKYGSPSTTDKSWSAVTSGSDPLHPPPYQSPQFQHEFPSLSAGDGGPQRTGDATYTPGLSLRPQTEGSWIQGGSRPGAEGPPRNNLAPLGAPPQLSAQVGHVPEQQPFPAQFRGVMPSFMYKGNFPPAGNNGGTPNAITPPVNGRNRPENRPDSRPSPRLIPETDELAHRPIIKEEDLSRMDEISRDMGWASHDDIDYNQKLSFSDDESTEKNLRKEHKLIQHKETDKMENHINEGQRNWTGPRSGPHRGGRMAGEDEEVWVQQRRHQNSKEIDLIVQRAKQRREEEEKRFSESTKQGAAKKLHELEEKKLKREQEASQGPTHSNKPIISGNVPLPEFQKEKERDRDSRSRTPNDSDEKGTNQSTCTFRQLTQIEGKNVIRKHTKGSDRDNRERDGPSGGSSFSKYDMPPRFLKQQRNNSGMHNPQPHYQQYNDGGRWMPNNNPNISKSPNASVSRKLRSDSPEGEVDENRRDYKRQGSDDSYRSSGHRSQPDTSQSQKMPDNRYVDDHHEYNRHEYDHNRRERDDDKWHREKEKKQDYSSEPISRQSGEDWHERRDKLRDEKPQDRYEKHQDNRQDNRYERPQRPDSRDSRASRDSRHSRDSARESESREYMWSESVYDPPHYDDKRRDLLREDRRQVPGPITKERIEADDIKNDKRKLIQLKKGQILDKKISDNKKEDKILENPEYSDKKMGNDPNITTKAWADATSPTSNETENQKYSDGGDTSKSPSTSDMSKHDSKSFDVDSNKKSDTDYKERDDKRGSSNRNRGYQTKGWGSGSEYHRSGWSKRSGGSRSIRTTGSQRPTSSVSGDYHASDSEGSFDDHGLDSVKDQKSPKPARKNEKDDKNREIKQDKHVLDRKIEKQDLKRDNYVPRGEPSRHGRGGSNIRSRGSMGKRIDGYGPPPTKSPFSHHDDKEKKLSSDETVSEVISSEDKVKLNQQALSASIIGNSRKDSFLSQGERKNIDKSDRNKLRKDGPRRGKSRTKGDIKREDDTCDTTSDNSDERSDGKSIRKSSSKPNINSGRGPLNSAPRHNNPPRLSGDKSRNYNSRTEENLHRQNSSGTLRSQQGTLKKDKNEENTLCSAIADISLKGKDDLEQNDEGEEKVLLQADSEGFQEVKSKKNIKERQKSIEEKPVISKPQIKSDKDLVKGDRKLKIAISSSQMTPQQISNIPPLMSTPVNPPQVLPQSNKNQFERPRSRLAPRFAKQRENNRLQKAQMQHHNMCDVSDMNKVNQTVHIYNIKESVQSPMSNAWDKPLVSQLRTNMESDAILGVSIDKNLEHPSSSSQNNSPNNDKIVGKAGQLPDKAILDGSTPPVNTIIFENTNFKSTPVACNTRVEKSRSKLEDGNIDNSVMTGFNKPIDLINKNEKQNEPIQLPMSVDFFDSEQITDEKTLAKNLCLPRSMHNISGNISTISTADALNFKIASVKKVWETPTEHSVGQEDSAPTFVTSFVSDPNALDPNAFSKGNDTAEDNHEVYSPSPNQTASNSTTNVCKVKPTQQVTGNSGQTVLSSTAHQQHANIVGPGLMGNPLSPPPMQTVIGTGMGMGQPPQQFTTNQHISYQTGLGASSQYNMPAIPSPPTVLYNSAQQLQQQTGVYGPFQLDQTGVLGAQSRQQYSQYANHYGLSQTGSSPYSAQSMAYLQTAQHPPPTAQAPQDLYQNMNNYRLSTAGHFGQNQQLNNPTTVLISSTSNSLMSATVKPSSQPMSAIGTKAGGVGQAYQQQSQQGQQVYMTYDPSIPANYLPNAGVLQRGPAGPVQNNVVPALQQSASSYYSGSTGGTTGYYQQPGSSLQSAQLQQHQTGYGLQGFGNQSHTNAGLQSFNSHFLSTPIIAAALNAQQFRSSIPNAAYLKSVGNQSIGDQTGRPQQLKSPGTQELSSVFNSVSQIPSPKTRQNSKQPPPQPSPTGKHNYNLYQGGGNQQSGNVQRYPAPIQRPVNFQQNIGSTQQNNSSNQKHRSNNSNNKAPSRQYYGNQTTTLTAQAEKTEESKITESVVNNSISGNVNSSNVVSKTAIGSGPITSGETPPVETNSKEKDTSAMKD